MSLRVYSGFMPNAYYGGILLQCVYAVVPLLTLVYVQIFSVFHFSALGVANKVFGVIISALFISEVLISVAYRVRLSLIAIALTAYLILMSLYGYFLGNDITNIISDLILLLSPLTFYIYGARRRQQTAHVEKLAGGIIYGYFLMSVLFFVFIFAPANLLLSTEQARADFPMMMGLYFIFIFRGRPIIKILSFGGLIFTVFASGYKLALLLVVVDLVIVLFVWIFQRTDMVTKLVRIVTILVSGFIVAVLVPIAIADSLANPQLSQNTLIRKIKNFSNVVSLPINRLIIAYDAPFDVLDASTAERVYELKQTISANTQKSLTILFGQGLGGTVDLSGTEDPGVMQAYDDLSKVKVVHLGLTWVLLKGGLIGLLIYFAFLYKVAKYGIRLLSGQGVVRQSAGLALINYLVGVNIVFGYWIKAPLLGVILGLKMNERSKMPANTNHSRGVILWD